MPQPTPVEDNTDFPKQTDVAVIGGGIAGMTTALELAERGLDVTVFEKGHIACEQSSRNWGWCRQMGRDPEELPLIKVSMKLWRAMNERVGAETGYRQTGTSFLCESDEKLAKRKSWFDKYAGQYGLSTRMVSAEEANKLAPNNTLSMKGGLYTPDDGRAEPTLAVPAMAQAAQKLGVKVFQNCAVRTLERKAGSVCGIVTELGLVHCKQVLIAGGAWSRRFCHNAGVYLPQLSVVNSVMRTSPFDAGYDISTIIGQCAIRKRLDGGYTLAHADYSVADIMPDSFRLLSKFWHLAFDERKDYKFRIGERSVQEAKLKRRWRSDEISPFEQVRVLDPKPVASILDDALKSLRTGVPVFENVQIEERWAGVIDVTPDVVPVISPVKQIPGLYMSTGFSGHGFGLAPGAGKLMAEIMCGENTCVDPTPFKLERFR